MSGVCLPVAGAAAGLLLGAALMPLLRREGAKQLRDLLYIPACCVICGLCALRYGTDGWLPVVSGCVASVLLLFAAFVDGETGLMPVWLLRLLFLPGLLLTVAGTPDGVSWPLRLAGLAASLLVYGGLYLGSRRILGREGLGLGDVELMAAAGLLLGVWQLLLATLLASVSASAVLLLRRAFRDNAPGREYAFAPYLAGGVLASLIAGRPVIDWYANLFRF